MIKEKDWTKIDYSKYASIMSNVTNSCICYPTDGDSVNISENNGILAIKGWATGDGDKGIPVT